MQCKTASASLVPAPEQRTPRVSERPLRPQPLRPAPALSAAAPVALRSVATWTGWPVVLWGFLNVLKDDKISSRKNLKIMFLVYPGVGPKFPASLPFGFDGVQYMMPQKAFSSHKSARLQPATIRLPIGNWLWNTYDHLKHDLASSFSCGHLKGQPAGTQGANLGLASLSFALT